jgi:hypothetical protein
MPGRSPGSIASHFSAVWVVDGSDFRPCSLDGASGRWNGDESVLSLQRLDSVADFSQSWIPLLTQ